VTVAILGEQFAIDGDHRLVLLTLQLNIDHIAPEPSPGV
jgi:hypothetical protein